MTIIDDLSLGVADVPVAHILYSRVSDIFGIRCLAEGEGVAAFGLDEATFWDPARVAILSMGFCKPGTGRSGDLPLRTERALRWWQLVLDAFSSVASPW